MKNLRTVGVCCLVAMSFGTPVHMMNKKYADSVDCAVEKGDLDSLKKCIKRGDVVRLKGGYVYDSHLDMAKFNAHNNTHNYCSKKVYEFLKALEKFKRDVESNKKDAVVAWLKDNKEFVNFRFDNGATVLFCAVKHGHNDLIEILVKAGAKVCHEVYENCFLITPLCCAITTKQVETVKLLLDLGASRYQSCGSYDSASGFVNAILSENNKTKYELEKYKQIAKVLRGD